MNQKTYFPIFVLFLIQSLLALLSFNYIIYLLEKNAGVSFISVIIYALFSFLSVAITIGGIYFVRNSFYNVIKETELTMQQENMSNIEQLLNTLRAQRHDFMNHIQVIYGYSSIGKIKEIKKFIEGMHSEMAAVSQFAKTDNPSISALLMVKSGVAETRNINIHYDIEGQFKDVPMPSWELTRVLGNLINNAMDAVQDLPPENCYIEVNLQENANGFLFQVCNLGEPIPPDLLDQIFNPGFTTKGDKGTGMGLYIVRDLVEKHKGTVDVMSTIEEGTVFNVSLPI